jgi:hypothetical protein
VLTGGRGYVKKKQNLLKYSNIATLSSLFRGSLIVWAPGLSQVPPKRVLPLKQEPFEMKYCREISFTIFYIDWLWIVI